MAAGPSGPANDFFDDPNVTPIDPVKAYFDLGVTVLTRGGQSERNARSTLGRLRQAVGDEHAASIVMAARTKSDPAAYIFRAMQPKVREVAL